MQIFCQRRGGRQRAETAGDSTICAMPTSVSGERSDANGIAHALAEIIAAVPARTRAGASFR
jgi:hypothetical protein